MTDPQVLLTLTAAVKSLAAEIKRLREELSGSPSSETSPELPGGEKS